MLCPKCKSILPNHLTACPSCGEKLTPPPPKPQQSAPQPNPYQEQRPQPNPYQEQRPQPNPYQEQNHYQTQRPAMEHRPVNNVKKSGLSSVSLKDILLISFNMGVLFFASIFCFMEAFEISATVEVWYYEKTITEAFGMFYEHGTVVAFLVFPAFVAATVFMMIFFFKGQVSKKIPYILSLSAFGTAFLWFWGGYVTIADVAFDRIRRAYDDIVLSKSITGIGWFLLFLLVSGIGLSVVNLLTAGKDSKTK